MNLTTATPVEIDTALAEIQSRVYSVEDRIFFLNSSVADYEKGIEAEANGNGMYTGYSRYADKVLRMKDEINSLHDQRIALLQEMAPFEAEFTRRGGWTRAFLVTNGNGHVHSSMGCSSCYPTTRYYWVTSLSGHDEAEIVEKAGERACTVCYPSAPVDAKGTSLFTPDEVEKQKAREAREAKRAEKDAAKITVEGMLGWTNEGRGKHVYPTTRGATNAIAGLLKSLTWYGVDHPTSAEWLNNLTKIREALEAKGVEYDYDKALAAARKKTTRDGATPRF